MIRRFSYIIAAIMATINVACQSDIDTVVPVADDNTPEGWVAIEFGTNVPVMTEVEVRAADPDGIDVHNLTLFCFNAYGLYIAHVEAEIDTTNNTYKAVIPEDTRIIHFVGNQNPYLYDQNMFVNRTEDEIKDGMVGASGMIVYWSRFVFNSTEGFQTQLYEANGGTGIRLIGNQAKISIENGDSNPYIDITGWTVTNIYAYGTTAPYHPEYGFPTDGTSFEWPGDDFITLPDDRTKMSDIVDVTTRPEHYIFEHENSLLDPVSVIIKGKPAGGDKELYYHVSILDTNGEQLMIRRNHHYKINISGALTYGCETFDEALSAPATNNVWISVEDWINEVSYDGVTLAVKQTSVVMGEDKAGKSLELKYTITTSSGLTDADKAEVTWAENNTVAAHNFNHTFDPTLNVDNGTITIQLLEMGDSPMLEGTLIVKKGRLHRTIRVVLIKTQVFTPVWAATQIYGGDVGELATFKFNVPEDFPFFPFNVYVSVNSLDVRTATTGRVLPIVNKGDEEWYGIDNEYGYKYVYTVTEPGTQRLYFHSILEHENGGMDTITIEAEFFRTETKEFYYVNHQNAIDVADLERYRASGIQDEYIYYRLVPRKINAPVKLDICLNDVSGTTPRAINASADDEFFIYSNSLDSLSNQADRDMFNLPNNWEWDCRFYTIDDNYWKQSSNGRILMFKPTKIDKTGDDMGRYSIYLKTNAARSNDMIRIASNQNDSKSALPGKENELYGGNTYRSFIFELATYNPFRFAAQVAINGGAPEGSWGTGDNPDPTDMLVWTYLPNQQVDISFDITSFEGSDGHSADPFGTSFEVYIDAPMLKIDESRLTAELADKLKPHPSIPGRFVYTVDASREEERRAGSGNAAITDAFATSQANERKTLPFITSKITSAGEIVISSQSEVCEFYEKRFRVINQLIEGAIVYDNSDVQSNIAHGEFVSFAVERTGVRIGSINITSDGHFELNLRAEYAFSWSDDAVVLNYKKNDKVYEARYNSLEDMYDSVMIDGDAVTLLET